MKEGGFLGTPFSAEAIIAIFTILLFAATFALYLATRDLVRGANQTAERQLRAYVGIERAELNFLGPLPIARATVVTRNFGTTPAENFVTHLYLGWQPNPLRAKVEVTTDIGTNSSPLMPGQTNITICDVGFDGIPNYIELVRSGSIAVYLLGYISYTDIFGRMHSDDVTMIACGERAFGRSPFTFIERNSLATCNNP